MLICTYCERQVPRPQITAIKSEREKNLAQVDNFFWILYISFFALLACFIHSIYIQIRPSFTYVADRQDLIRPFIHVGQCLFLKETESCSKGFHFSGNCRDFLILTMLFLL